VKDKVPPEQDRLRAPAGTFPDDRGRWKDETRQLQQHPEQLPDDNACGSSEQDRLGGGCCPGVWVGHIVVLFQSDFS
jgi:hypothetical protein